MACDFSKMKVKTYLPNTMARRLTAVLPVVGNLVHAAVGVGAGVVPAAEHGLNGLDELRLRVGGEVRAHFFLVERFEFGNKSLHVVGVQLHVLGDALGFLHLIDDFFEFAFVFTQWKGFKTDSRDAGGQYVGCFLSFLFTLMEMSAAG